MKRINCEQFLYKNKAKIERLDKGIATMPVSNKTSTFLFYINLSDNKFDGIGKCTTNINSVQKEKGIKGKRNQGKNA